MKAVQWIADLQHKHKAHHKAHKKHHAPKNEITKLEQDRKVDPTVRQVTPDPKKSPGKHADNLSKNVNHELNREFLYLIAFLAVFMVTLQAPVPVQSPLQPAKLPPASAVAVNTALVPAAKAPVHAVPQEMPLEASPCTTPLPLVVMVRVNALGCAAERTKRTGSALPT